jgi:hypothetical protein
MGGRRNNCLIIFRRYAIKMNPAIDDIWKCEPYRHNLVRQSQFLRVTSELFEWGRVIKGF